MISKLHDTKFNYHFITPILKSHAVFFVFVFLVNINIYLSTSGNLAFKAKGELGEQKLQNFPQMTFFLPYIFLQSDWLVQVSHEI